MADTALSAERPMPGVQFRAGAVLNRIVLWAAFLILSVVFNWSYGHCQ